MLGVSLVASLHAPGMSVVHRKASARPSGSKDRDASNVTVIGSGPERTAFGETITAVGGEVARTVTVEHAWSRAPAPFVTCTHTVRAAPVAADCGTVNVGRAFVESLNEPLSSRSQAYVTAPPDGSEEADPSSWIVWPRWALYGPPASACGPTTTVALERQTPVPVPTYNLPERATRPMFVACIPPVASSSPFEMSQNEMCAGFVESAGGEVPVMPSRVPRVCPHASRALFIGPSGRCANVAPPSVDS